MTFIGSGGPSVTKERSCSCVLVDSDTLIDCGGGALKNLKTLGTDLTEIERVLLSHFHADHIGDLVSLIWAMDVEGRKIPLKIYGYEGVGELVSGLLKLMNTPSTLMAFKIECHPLKGGEEVGDFKAHLTKHKPPNLSYRISRGGRSLCYTGDTAHHEALFDFASGCDLLIHESVFLEEQKNLADLTNHSTAREAGRVAGKAGVKTLVLFHIFPYNAPFEGEYLAQASKEFSGRIIVARDLLTCEV